MMDGSRVRTLLRTLLRALLLVKRLEEAGAAAGSRPFTNRAAGRSGKLSRDRAGPE